VPIEEIAEFRFRLDIVPVPGLQDGFDVDAYLTSDLKEIRVDRFIQENRLNRYRFSIAHELAHLVVHQDVFKAMRFSTIQEWKVAMQSIPEDQYGYIEWQAYSLAGLILVPPVPLMALFKDKVKEAKVAGIDLYEMDERLQKSVTSHLGKYFEVSSEVVARRMKADKLWER
jgi:Zn-dependent peptidase ImmA (M78 family)